MTLVYNSQRETIESMQRIHWSASGIKDRESGQSVQHPMGFIALCFYALHPIIHTYKGLRHQDDLERCLPFCIGIHATGSPFHVGALPARNVSPALLAFLLKRHIVYNDIKNM